jgi:hypothetical protein
MSTQTKVQTPLTTPTITMAAVAQSALTSPTKLTAPLGDFEPDGEPLEDEPPPPAGDVGVNTDAAFAKHDVAAALAAATSEGAVLLTVALPAKLQDWGLRLFAW